MSTSRGFVQQPQQRRQPPRSIVSGMVNSSSTTGIAAASSSASASYVHSRGQQARRNSFTQCRPGAEIPIRRRTRSNSNTSQHQRPILGGMTALDLVLIAAAYAVNLIKTLGLAELADVALKSMWYCVTSLPFEFYKRWNLSHPPAPSYSSDFQDSDAEPSSSNDIKPSQRPHPIASPPSQLSPFHHLGILFSRFGCMNFPHLLPRVLFAEDTMLPFVGWRTGGASWELMKEIRGEQIKTDGSAALTPSFRAIWMGPDAYSASESRRQSTASRQASTIFYLHGGGYSLGSVSFYSEALLRVLNKVCQIESAADPSAPLARCVAVEYDLSPTARFPAPLLQCLRCYAHLVEVENIEASSITFAGDSAGGNLAMAMLLVLSGQGGRELYRERDWSRLPLPGKALLISPWVDLRPSKAHAFAGLRSKEETARQRHSKRAHSTRRQPSDGNRGASGNTFSSQSPPSSDLTAAISSYEWDYIAAETLLYFAQIYAGVLKRPRRVMGPLGWIAHLGGILSRGLEEESRVNNGSRQRSTAARQRKRSRNDQMIDPARKLARAVKDFLDQPLFERLISQEELQRVSPPTSMSIVQPSFTSGLAPIVSLEDRRTDPVWKTQDLYVPILSSASSSSAMVDLDTNPILSPILGDWSKIQLERGCLVTWGERERMSADIEAWVELVHSGMGPEDLSRPPDHDRPRQDGEEERERYERLQRGKWLKTAVEHGSGGVHVWPFVAMYLAGSEAEREKGLDMLARFVARPLAVDKESSAIELQGLPENDAPAPQTPNVWADHRHGEGFFSPYSPGSIPSDIGEGVDEDQDGQEPIDGSQSPMFTTRGAGRAFTEEEFKEVMGFGVQYGSDPVQNSRPRWDRAGLEASATSSVVPSTPPTRRIGSSSISNTTPSQRFTQPQSQQPRSETFPISSPPSSSSSTSSPTTSMKGSISRRIEREHTSGQVDRGRRIESNAAPLWWTTTSSQPSNLVSVPTLPLVTPSVSSSNEVGGMEGETGSDEEEGADEEEEEEEEEVRSDIEGDEDSSSSPPISSSTSPPLSTRTLQTTSDSSTPLNVSYFGLSYALRREAEEGLSDIAEESSVLSSGFASVSGVPAVHAGNPSSTGSSGAFGVGGSMLQGSDELPQVGHVVSSHPQLHPASRIFFPTFGQRGEASDLPSAPHRRGGRSNTGEYEEEEEDDDDDGEELYSPLSDEEEQDGVGIGEGRGRERGEEDLTSSLELHRSPSSHHPLDGQMEPNLDLPPWESQSINDEEEAEEEGEESQDEPRGGEEEEEEEDPRLDSIQLESQDPEVEEEDEGDTSTIRQRPHHHHHHRQSNDDVPPPPPSASSARRTSLPMGEAWWAGGA